MNIDKTTLWQKEYTLSSAVAAYTVGKDHILDMRLVPYDCRASIAHAKMLNAGGWLSDTEAADLITELKRIEALGIEGDFEIPLEQEDCHTAIENELTVKLGEVGQKIHTARSRNDQVLSCLRLYYKDMLHEIGLGLKALSESMIVVRERDGVIAIPGFTHTRKAMPSSIGMWIDAFHDSLQDDLLLLDTSFEIIDQSPLGTAAGYGVPLQIDRELTARELGFARVQQNPIYAQHSRAKFDAILVNLLVHVMLDLNLLASDLIFMSLPEFGFFILPDEILTGSSIMPQKKNPDVLELVRANYHAVLAVEGQVKTSAANMISGYHRDRQLTKGPMFESIDITRSSLNIMNLVLEKLTVDPQACQRAMTSELYATQEAYELVEKGVPFREAYRKISSRYS